MKAEQLDIAGAVLLRADVHEDERGSFRRVVDAKILAAHGLDPRIDQVSVAANHSSGTVRGLHYQAAPHGEAKTLWCSAGAVFDVIVDLRPTEPTYGQWRSVQLSADEPVALHVPEGVAHGYQTLTDNSELVYLINSPYVAESARSLLWSDRTLDIEWPLPVSLISARDQKAPPWPPEP
jgi:dTDP-4-dehydrorhamnose 3,5-epimerase